VVNVFKGKCFRMGRGNRRSLEPRGLFEQRFDVAKAREKGLSLLYGTREQFRGQGGFTQPKKAYERLGTMTRTETQKGGVGKRA